MIRNPRDLLNGTVEVSALPMIFTRINDAVNDPRSSIADIGRIISEDSSLSARLLRIVNSVLYSFPSKIETITRAVTIVGTQQLRDVALATSVMKMFAEMSEDLLNMEAFWHHSIGCGITARILASYRREPNVERFLVAGMLHDIGRLLIHTKMADQARAALLRCESSGELLYKVEVDEFGFDHAAVGGALLQLWKLPASLEEVVTCHHNPRRAQRYAVETAVIHVADVIAHAMRLGNSGERFVPPLDSRAWERIGIPLSYLSETMDQVDRQINDAIKMIRPDARK
ncbi:MAG: phosphohydrolase [Acidobacteria bacterium]|nr:MAG: phosphohydrolase [Acidobacteriota bacterium]